MNLKEITKNILTEAKKLEHGSEQEKQCAQELTATAQKLEAYRKANERPITEETLKQIRTGTTKFTPRRLNS